jgi:murein DD-endopeptidase MepM/ murein hydrolase activator NlpD
LHTDVPSRPREEVIEYKVQRGDTVFGIAEKFGLKPETILWGNYNILADDPHRLRPGQVLNILPVDGTYYQWHAGDNLRVVAKFFGVKPEDIIDYPANHLPPDTDPEHPHIAPGTWLVVPGGHRAFVSWSAPQISRKNPAVAKVLGPGFCGKVYTGPVGTGTFIWPTTLHYLSGYDYSPAINHYGIDIAGKLGYPVYAVDNGVVVYAGWNNWGYGNVVVIDHGNGWQSLYAHLSRILVQCGQAVYQGDMIGAIGSTGNSTGPHLHFELRHEKYGKVNPWNFLPKP